MRGRKRLAFSKECMTTATARRPEETAKLPESNASAACKEPRAGAWFGMGSCCDCRGAPHAMMRGSEAWMREESWQRESNEQRR